MEIIIRKIGNSKGVVIPAPLLKQLGLDIDDKADVVAENGRLVIAPKAKTKYSLAELIAKCDQDAAMPEELIEWEAVAPVGNEW
ncbi:AbrB/MazE/SpoVT family DNA-binding domain-containing protein [Rheinheimera sp.]|uniref:AbrB/MazE/SpoVT family DNA-binding domain-containing protein n=1 Tax=Rheinheimera sp. TaxID=1869214 RepID=UPI002733220A|nr:AbrB/MazE/SpoVT family DNA-binding domain-containing protein [Rheinheimera sp.]MDP2714691.1 AbrB/MazE/SpoVT family DNA-binding domain-containing protein [Rheinheimera sp.]